MATKYNDTLLKQYNTVWEAVQIGSMHKGALGIFAQAKRLARTSLSKHHKAWRVARGL